MVIGPESAADSAARIGNEVAAEMQPAASVAVGDDLMHLDSPAGEVGSETMSIILNEELLDGPFHVEVANEEDHATALEGEKTFEHPSSPDDVSSEANENSESAVGNANTNSSLKGMDAGFLHAAVESGKKIAFPVEDWSEKASALKGLVLDRGAAVSRAIRRLSGGKKDDLDPSHAKEDSLATDEHKEVLIKDKARRWLALRRGEAVSGEGTDGQDTNKSEVISKPEIEDFGRKMKGRITVFTMSGSQDCRAAKTYLRSKGLPFVDINLDAFPERKAEMEEKTGKSTVPQIFFNNSVIGGYNDLNAEDFDEQIKEVFENEAPPDSILPPDDIVDENNGKLDEFAEIARRLRAAVVVKDRFLRFRVVNSCFIGSDAIDFLVEDQYCEREEAVEVARKLAGKHFLHSVTEDHVFEDGNYLYRFLEHEPGVIADKCLNFSGAVNDLEPKPAIEIGNRLRKLILAIYESYVSEDGRHVNYTAIGNSAEFKRFTKVSEELQRVDLVGLNRQEKLALFLNIYNMFTIHAVVHLGYFPEGTLERRKFFGEFQYLIGGYTYCLSAIENGLLRGNQRPPYSLARPFAVTDKRLQVALVVPEPLIHFGLVRGARSSPALKCYSFENVENELKAAASEFLEKDGGIVIESTTKYISLSRLFKGYSADFGKSEIEMLKWIAEQLESKKSEQLSKLLEDTSMRVVYQPFDWSTNS